MVVNLGANCIDLRLYHVSFQKTCLYNSLRNWGVVSITVLQHWQSSAVYPTLFIQCHFCCASKQVIELIRRRRAHVQWRNLLNSDVTLFCAIWHSTQQTRQRLSNFIISRSTRFRCYYASGVTAWIDGINGVSASASAAASLKYRPLDWSQPKADWQALKTKHLSRALTDGGN